ncbi:MAG: hypothetical protein LUF82_05970 [Clostridia bacterium]|nr:hypothetical protein [Clostridia bacterium]
MKKKLSVVFLAVISCFVFCFSAASCTDKHTHLLTHYNAVEATCTEDGNTEYWYCTECFKYFSDKSCKNEINLSDTVISKTGHSFTNYISDNNATCTENGTKTATCDNDGCSVTNTITNENSALGHIFTNYISDNNATCTNDGTKTAQCERDGCCATDTITEENTASGHDYNTENIQWVWDGYTSATATLICNNDNSHRYSITATVSSEITQAATCQDTGIKTYTASVSYSGKIFTDTKTEVLEKTSHSLVTEYREDEDWIWGYNVTHCETCSYEYETAVPEIEFKTFQRIGYGTTVTPMGVTNNIIYRVQFTGGYGELTYNFKVYASRDYTNVPVYYEYTTTQTESFTFYCPYSTSTMAEALEKYVIVITVTDSKGHSISAPLAANFTVY